MLVYPLVNIQKTNGRIKWVNQRTKLQFSPAAMLVYQRVLEMSTINIDSCHSYYSELNQAAMVNSTNGTNDSWKQR
jgi:hypothetical protein